MLPRAEFLGQSTIDWPERGGIQGSEGVLSLEIQKKTSDVAGVHAA